MAYCLPAPAVTHLPLCLWEGRAPNGSQVALIWYSLGSNPLFCEHVLWAFQGHCAALEPFPGKFFVVLFCFVLFWSLGKPHGFGCFVKLVLRFSLGHSSLFLTLGTDEIVHTSLSNRHSLLMDVSVWAASLLVVAVICVFCVCILFVRLCCSLRFQSSPLTCLWESFLLYGNFSSFSTPSPEWASIPKTFVSVFVFSILSYLVSKRSGCLFGCLVCSDSVQKLFCGNCSTFKWSFDDSWGRNWSLSPIPRSSLECLLPSF